MAGFLSFGYSRTTFLLAVSYICGIVSTHEGKAALPDFSWKLSQKELAADGFVIRK